ncbi:MAG: hypothetical protein ACR2N9_01335, partial [Acidimicrobiia bacterium]
SGALRVTNPAQSCLRFSLQVPAWSAYCRFPDTVEWVGCASLGVDMRYPKVPWPMLFQITGQVAPIAGSARNEVRDIAPGRE